MSNKYKSKFEPDKNCLAFLDINLENLRSIRDRIPINLINKSYSQQMVINAEVSTITNPFACFLKFELLRFILITEI